MISHQELPQLTFVFYYVANVKHLGLIKMQTTFPNHLIIHWTQ